MLIEQSYEPAEEYVEDRMKLVLNLPKKIIKGTCIYNLKIKFVEVTYLDISYKNEDSTFVEILVNLNSHISEYLDTLKSFLLDNGAIDVQLMSKIIEKRFN